jgi:hypothetical protein
MKLSLAFVALAAADSQAPIISIDLDGVTGTHSTMAARHENLVSASVGGMNTPTKHCYKNAHAKYDNTCAETQNSFADECEVDTACQEPVASAYDHHDGDISTQIDTVYRLFVKSDRNANPVKEDSVEALDIAQRGEWVITYDVEDGAGNDAEQVQFALIIIDTQKPAFTNSPTSQATTTGCTSAATCTGRNYITTTQGSTNVKIELCGGETSNYEWITAANLEADDNYDTTTLTEANSVMIFKVDGTQQQSSTWTFPTQTIEAKKVYNYEITSADFADIFGSSNANNVVTEIGSVTMEDTIIPTIIDPGTPGYWECGFDGTGMRVTPGYSDCYDDHTGVYNTVNVKVECTPHATALSGYYLDGMTGTTLATTGDDTLEHCLGVKSGTGVSESKYGIDSESIVSAAKTDGTYKVTLTYDVQDKFGNDAATWTQSIPVKDTIAPTLFITESQERTASATYGAYGTHSVNGDHCLEQDEVKTTPVNGVYDVTQAHCKQAHKDSNGGATQDHPDGRYTTLDHKSGDTATATELTAANAYSSEVTIQHSAGYAQDYKFVQELMEEGTGFGCYDICSSTSTTTTWVNDCENSVEGDATKEFNMLKPGTYYLKYVCSDEAANTATACRTFINVDKTRPVITILAAANKADGIWYVEASRDNNYVDAGATCSDMVDGNISQDVEVSGDVVNMAAVGTYKINYNCEDSAGQTAIQATRTVVVQDTTCPTCKIPGGSDTITVEASFPYTEEASTCTDTLDGAMPNAVIYGTVDVESTGEYTLTYSVTDKNNNGADAAACESAHINNGNHFTKTVVVEDTMVPIISLKYRGSNLVGMMAESTTTVNGWVIGAVASAVSGVALLGYAATRKATVATSVPV